MKNKPLCALVIGHSEASPGAINKHTGLTEFAFNEPLSMDIADAVKNVDVVRVYRDNYYHNLPVKINSLQPDFIISLHCNSHWLPVSGTEVLYLDGSKLGVNLATILQLNLDKALNLNYRGVKATKRNQRGGLILTKTSAPCVIAEPFFIDNNKDLSTARENIDQLVQAYADTIEQFAKHYYA